MLLDKDDPEKNKISPGSPPSPDELQKSAYDIVEERSNLTGVLPPPTEQPSDPEPPADEVEQSEEVPSEPQSFWKRFAAWCTNAFVVSINWIVKTARAFAALFNVTARAKERSEQKVRTPVDEFVAESVKPPRPPINIKIASFFHHWSDLMKKRAVRPQKQKQAAKLEEGPSIAEPIAKTSPEDLPTPAAPPVQHKVAEPSPEQQQSYLASILSKNIAQRIGHRLPFSREERKTKMIKDSNDTGMAGTPGGPQPKQFFSKPAGPVVMMILDGYGIGVHDKGNAIFQVEPNFVSELERNFPFIPIEAAGPAVGLPEGQIGNSEVGHMHIGAGRVVFTGLSLINEEVRQGRIVSNKAVMDAVANALNKKTKLHIAGLLSPGGVHSHQDQIFALIRAVVQLGVKPIVHVFCDGRDVAQKSVRESLQQLLAVCVETGASVGTISGRYFAMDRDQNFDRVMKTFEVMTGQGAVSFNDPLSYIDQSYEQGITDEFIVPAFNLGAKESFVQDGDSFIFANYRPDRARELSHLFINSALYQFQPPHRPKDLFFVTLAQYDGITPNAVAYPPVYPDQTLGQIIAANGLTQLRIAETEKYAHVTFFLDGGKEVTYPGMDKLLIPSPKVATYDLQPEMSAVSVTDHLLGVIDKYDFIVINYANPDMVGHTGILSAAEQAIRVVDQQVRRVYDRVKELNGTIFLLADHGNAEVMIDKDGKPQTAHTTNPVPFIITDRQAKFVVSTGSLANVAPTILKYLGIKIPPQMTATPLI